MAVRRVAAMRKIENAERRLIDEGRRVLYELGYPALDVKEVAATCGVGIGTFYSRFGSKKGFALEILADDCRARYADIREALTTDLDMEAALVMTAAAIDGYRDRVATVFWQLPLERDEGPALLRAETDRVRELAASILRRAAEAGRIPVGSDSDIVVDFVTRYLTSGSASDRLPLDRFLACLSTLTSAPAGSPSATLEEEASDNIPAGMGIFDVEGDTVRQVYLNDGFYRMIGADRAKRERFQEGDAAGSVHPDDRGGLLKEAQAAIREGRQFEYRFRILTGDDVSYMWIGITASHRPQGPGVERFYAAYFDVGGYVDEHLHERERYDRALDDIITAVPGSAGVAHVDLTENSFTWARPPRPELARATSGRSWDDLVEAVCRGVQDAEKADELRSFRCADLLEMFRQGRNHVSSNYRRVGEDGRSRWFTSRAYMLRNPADGHVECVAYTQDISADRLRSDIFQIITSRSFDLVALIHLDTRRFEAVYLGETLPAAYRDLLPERGAVCDFDRFCAVSAAHMDGVSKRDYEGRISSDRIRDEVARNGGGYEFTIRLCFSDDGTPVYRRLLHYSLTDNPDTVLVIESDVTTEILQEQERNAAVLAQAERDRLIMDSIMGGICVLRMDVEGHLSVDYFNSYVFEMLGYGSEGLPQTPEEAAGTPAENLFADALSFIHPDDRDYVTGMYREHCDDPDGSFVLEPYRMAASDGTLRWIKVKARRGASTDGRYLFYVAMHDVTQEVELQREIAQQMEDERRLRREADAANAAKTDFLSRMSHDIRTPLNGVIGMAYLARQESNPPHTDECLGKIDASAKFLLGLINDVLDMSRVESGRVELHPEPYPIEEFGEYLDAVIRPLCDEKGLHLVVEEDVVSDVWPLMDHNAVNQILFNLLGNAVKFTPEGGTVSYLVRATPTGQDRLSIEHRIADDGVGISEAFLARIFEPFSQEGRDDTSDDRGSGLGLAIVKRLVDLMGGTIEVESEPGRGTVFTVVLEFDTVPADGGARTSDLPETAAGEITLAGAHVLLCEDHPLNQEIARALLSAKGALVDVADDGRAGLEMFSRSALGYYDAILMDVRMPVMDGCRSTQAIRATDRDDAGTVPIIAMTADAFEDDVRRCLAAGMDAHIAKPIDPGRLTEMLAGAIARRRGR